ncbi:MAG TPA: polysaccharide deacetylase family protein [Firmicutes bacterium]|nr:polysaccharide deacetylase family protein [Candidatus Fermentithermobacillaceae bacterium]
MLIYLKPKTRQKMLLVTAFFLVLLGARMGAVVQIEPGRGATAKIGPLTQVNTSEPQIGVIVDVSDATPEEIRRCLSTLESLAVKATWFLSGTFVEAQSDVVKEILDKGHEFGLKGTDEKPMDRLEATDIKDRIMRSRKAFEKANIEPAPFLYPPQGRFSEKLLSVAFEEGYQGLKPGVDGKVMKGKEEDAGKRLADSMRPGDIFIIRVSRKGMVPEKRYLESLSKHLKDHGLSMVGMSTLVKGVK